MIKRFTIWVIILAVLVLLMVGWGCHRSDGGSSDSIIWGRVRSIGSQQAVANLRFSLDGVNIFGATDETGYFRFEGVPEGNYEARFVRHGVLVSRLTFSVTEEQASNMDTIQLDWPDPIVGNGIISGVVQDIEGVPLVGAEIVLSRPDEHIQLTHTDENGAYGFEDLPLTGGYIAVASIDGYKPESASLGLNPDAPDRINFELEEVEPPTLPAGSVKVHVADDNDVDMPGVYVTVYPLNSLNPLFDTTGEALTNVAGVVQFDGIIEGPYILWVGKSGMGIKAREIYVTANLTLEQDVTLNGEYSFES